MLCELEVGTPLYALWADGVWWPCTVRHVFWDANEWDYQLDVLWDSEYTQSHVRIEYVRFRGNYSLAEESATKKTTDDHAEHFCFEDSDNEDQEVGVQQSEQVSVQQYQTWGEPQWF